VIPSVDLTISPSALTFKPLPVKKDSCNAPCDAADRSPFPFNASIIEELASLPSNHKSPNLLA
jgi:hypothetical protein